jgi:hypothetical protein
MTADSAPEILVNVEPVHAGRLWLAFELGCDDNQIHIRAALILREQCELHNKDRVHAGHDHCQTTVGSVSARLCKFNGHLDLPSGYQCLLNRGGTLREAVIDQCELYGDSVDVFLVEHMAIQPDYRGRDLGLIAMRALVRTFATGETLAATRPLPVMPEGEYLSPLELRDAQVRLSRYWQRAGFERYGRTDILVRAPGQR